MAVDPRLSDIEKTAVRRATGGGRTLADSMPRMPLADESRGDVARSLH